MCCRQFEFQIAIQRDNFNLENVFALYSARIFLSVI